MLVERVGNSGNFAGGGARVVSVTEFILHVGTHRLWWDHFGWRMRTQDEFAPNVAGFCPQYQLTWMGYTQYALAYVGSELTRGEIQEFARWVYGTGGGNGGAIYIPRNCGLLQESLPDELEDRNWRVRVIPYVQIGNLLPQAGSLVLTE